MLESESGEWRVLLIYLRDTRLEGLELEVSSPPEPVEEELQQSILQAGNRRVCSEDTFSNSLGCRGVPGGDIPDSQHF